MPPKKRKAANARGAHALPPPIPEGEVLTDNLKHKWKVGSPIGSGGFGLIYLASSNTGSKVTSATAEYVLKIEPVGNGPLFCEINFYLKAAKSNMIETWKKSKKLRHLGMPAFIASGQHESNGHKYRFMIMQRFSTDLQKLFENNNKSFKESDCFQVSLQILDILEYIHDNKYVHADIKASNLLLDLHDSSKVYLVDFGLANRYTSGDNHKIYKEDKRRCHDGTIEFTSLDSHRGAEPSRRGDLEILVYCLIQWLNGQLPWEDRLTDKEYVMERKIEFMKDPEKSLKRLFDRRSYLDLLIEIVTDIKTLEYDEKPDYELYRQRIISILQDMGKDESSQLTLTSMIKKRGSIDQLPSTTKRARQRTPRTPSSGTTGRERKQAHKTSVNNFSSDEDLDKHTNGEKKPQPKRLKEIKKATAPVRRNKRKNLHKSLITDDDEDENDHDFNNFNENDSEQEEDNPKKVIRKKTSSKSRKPVEDKGDLTASGTKKKPPITRKRLQKRSAATQTSPGLKGLARKSKHLHKQ